MEQKKAKMGRPTKYSEELVTTFCERLAAGGSLRRICEAADMPDMASILRWLNKYPDFCAQYTQAQNSKGEVLFAEFLELADTEPQTTLEAMHRKMQLDARKWAIARMYPRKYGDKVEQVHSGEIKVEKITRTIVDPKKD